MTGLRDALSGLGLVALLSLGPAPARGEAPTRCGATVPLAGHVPVLELRGAESYGSDRAAEPFVLAVMQAAGAWRALADRAAAQAALDELRRWSEAGALERIVEVGEAQSNTNSVYSLRRVLAGLLGSWAALREAATPETRRAIEAWLTHLVTLQDTDTGSRSGRGGPGAVSNRNNHAYLRASVDALWARLAGDRERAVQAAAVVSHAVEAMRRDGSLPLETARGARALWYQRHAIASLVLAGEALAQLGHDVYAPRADGASLHDAIGFLVAATRDPSLVAGYAAADRNPRPGTQPDRQDLGFLRPRPHGRHYMAWVELYLRRFPSHPNAAPLAALVQPGLDAARPLIDEISGGNTSCGWLPRPP